MSQRNRISAGPRSKGDRDYDWAWIGDHTPGPGQFSLLIRRGSDGTLAYYRYWSPHPVPLACTPPPTPHPYWPGQTGVDATKPEPAAPTTNDTP